MPFERPNDQQARIAAYVAAIVASSPPLTTEQRDRLATLLRPGLNTAKAA